MYLRMFLIAVLLCPGCGGSGDDKDSSDYVVKKSRYQYREGRIQEVNSGREQNQKEQPAISLLDVLELPDSVVIPEQMKPTELFAIKDRVVGSKLCEGDERDRVIEFYKDLLAKQGWTYELQNNLSNGFVTHYFKKQGLEMKIMAIPAMYASMLRFMIKKQAQ